MRDSLPLPERLAELATTAPDSPFLIETGGNNFSYAETYQRSLRWSKAWRDAGLGEGDHVLTMLYPGVDWFTAWMGLGLIKAVDVGVNTGFKAQMLRYAIEKSDATVMVIDAELQNLLTPDLVQDTRLKRLIVSGGAVRLSLPGVAVISVDDFLCDAIDAKTLPQLEISDTCCMIMTSGTTGPSKYVVCPWGSIKAGSVTFPLERMNATDTLYCFVPAFHGAARMMLWRVASLGGKCVFRRTFSRSDFWRDVRTYGCTFGFLPASCLPWLLSEPSREDDSDNPLRFVLSTPITPQSPAFGARFGVEMVTGYGMTETGTIAFGRFDPDKPTSCGMPNTGFPHFEFRLVNDRDEDVERGQVGELIIRAAEPGGMFARYYKDAAATAHAWRGGWFHTGDMLRQDDEGALYFADRVKDSLRRRGENISSLEVEAIVNRLADVQECAAIAVDDPGGEQELKLVVVLTPGVSLAPEALHPQLIDILPRFMVPRYIEVVDALPKTDATGRVMKARLREAGLSDSIWDSEAARQDAAL